MVDPKYTPKIISMDNLEEVATFWRKRLNLGDWRVSVRIVRGDGMSFGNSQGESSWKVYNACAAINLLDPVDYPRGVMVEQDMTKTLIHELLHLHFGSFMVDVELDKMSNAYMERAIEQIALTIINVARGE